MKNEVKVYSKGYYSCSRIQGFKKKQLPVCFTFAFLCRLLIRDTDFYRKVNPRVSVLS